MPWMGGPLKRLPPSKFALTCTVLLVASTVVELIWAIGSGSAWIRWMFVVVFAALTFFAGLAYLWTRRDAGDRDS